MPLAWRRLEHRAAGGQCLVSCPLAGPLPFKRLLDNGLDVIQSNSGLGVVPVFIINIPVTHTISITPNAAKWMLFTRPPIHTSIMLHARREYRRTVNHMHGRVERLKNHTLERRQCPGHSGLQHFVGHTGEEVVVPSFGQVRLVHFRVAAVELPTLGPIVHCLLDPQAKLRLNRRELAKLAAGVHILAAAAKGFEKQVEWELFGEPKAADGSGLQRPPPLFIALELYLPILIRVAATLHRPRLQRHSQRPVSSVLQPRDVFVVHLTHRDMPVPVEFFVPRHTAYLVVGVADNPEWSILSRWWLAIEKKLGGLKTCSFCRAGGVATYKHGNHIPRIAKRLLLIELLGLVGPWYKISPATFGVIQCSPLA
ncbi:MAG: hypothetical protein GY832_01440 [Chloroflexi bacterium]|nr:hypothetical protein [Chloroflexota bacterium]